MWGPRLKTTANTNNMTKNSHHEFLMWSEQRGTYSSRKGTLSRIMDHKVNVEDLKELQECDGTVSQFLKHSQTVKYVMGRNETFGKEPEQTL